MTALDHAELRELADRYSYALDHLDIDLFRELFCPEARLTMPYPPGDPRPAAVLDGADGWARAFGVLERFVATIHQVAYQHVDVDGDDARGETTGLAFEVYERDGRRRLRTRGVRYADEFRRVDGRWRFRSRTLSFDWVESREIAGPVPGTPVRVRG